MNSAYCEQDSTQLVLEFKVLMADIIFSYLRSLTDLHSLFFERGSTNTRCFPFSQLLFLSTAAYCRRQMGGKRSVDFENARFKRDAQRPIAGFHQLLNFGPASSRQSHNGRAGAAQECSQQVGMGESEGARKSGNERLPRGLVQAIAEGLDE